MSQRDNFSGGFLLGTIVGGIVGGVLGALLASGRLSELTASEEPVNGEPEAKPSKPKRQSLKATNGHADMETARRSLEDKIAQLNDAIDDVREQLGGINGTSELEGKRPIAREP